jgi:DNA polymerase-3 subunit alpha
VLLAENNTGYANLMKIVSKGFVEGFYYRPRVDLALLEEYHEGIIALSACLAGEVQRLIVRGMYEEAREAALKYRGIFGEDNYFLELQDHGIPDQKLVNQQLVRMSRELGIPLVATNDVHYTYEEDAESHDILLCIQTGKKLQDEDRMRYEGGQYFVKSPEQMAELFPYAPEALENTHRIAQRCHVEIEFGVTKLPKFDVPAPYTSWEYLNKLCYEGLERLYGDDAAADTEAAGQKAVPVLTAQESASESGSESSGQGASSSNLQMDSLKARLEYELSVIQKMGYVDYFLIVWDFIRYAREHDIMVGPGRGSAAGSLVSYTLGITKLDPIRYNLLFERFLNPERVSMPDIDVDFCFERRQEVIDYVVRKYGKDRVVQIVTFGTMAARGVIRDVGRVMDLPYTLCDTIAKLVPSELNITIDRALEVSQELRTMYEGDEQVHRLIDMSRRLEGLPRHTSMHAAGVVISQKSVDEYVPLSRAADGTITTQFTMTTLEELGLLKMDFLGLRTLTVIQNAVRLAEKSNGISIDIDKIDYNDKAVLDSLSTGRTDGVFQLESSGMKNFIKELKPQSLEDIIAGISLYRPGPMDFIPQYIRGKNHPETITYDCPQLKPILEPTYGCIVYQEQVMQIVRDLGGYTLGRSDLVRRAMSKKKASVMEKERHNFVYGNPEEGVPGCIANHIDENTANKIYDEMIDFAKYAFNKSHAAAYAVVSYQTAYLKYYYPVEFMAALMTSVIDNPTKVAEYILTCRQMGIRILPPDINLGESSFSVDGKNIRYGLSAIKSVGKPVIESIVAERNRNGLYRSLKDFVERLTGKEINRRTVECFIKAGAMDGFGATRKQLMQVYPDVMDHVSQEKKSSISGQMSLFDLMGEEEKKEYEVQMPDVGEFDKEELLAFEKEVLGIYISGHPLEKYEDLWRRKITNVTTDFAIDEETGRPRVQDGSKATVGGMITTRTIKYTKTNKTMAFLAVEDLLGTVEVVIFPKQYEKYQSMLQEDRKVFITGRVDAGDDKAGKLICENICDFADVPQELWIQFATMDEYREKESSLFDILRGSDGKDHVAIYVRSPKAIRRLGDNWTVRADEELIGRLTDLFGRENIKLTDKKQ